MVAAAAAAAAVAVAGFINVPGVFCGGTFCRRHNLRGLGGLFMICSIVLWGAEGVDSVKTVRAREQYQKKKRNQTKKPVTKGPGAVG